jgi:hypothetical protein
VPMLASIDPFAAYAAAWRLLRFSA